MLIALHFGKNQGQQYVFWQSGKMGLKVEINRSFIFRISLF